MIDVNMSNLLSKLIVDSMHIGNKTISHFTAERYIVAIIKLLRSPFLDIARDEIDCELTVLGETISERIGDFNGAEEVLMSHIHQEDNKSALADDLYINKKIQDAANLLSDVNVKDLDTFTLLLCIFADPSEAIRKVLTDFGVKSSAKTKKVENTDNYEAKLRMKFKENFDNNIEKDACDISDQKTDLKNVKPEMNTLVSDVKRIRTELQNCIYGQDNAINVFATGYFQARMLSMVDGDRKGPLATFLFAGPPGVGKTFLAEKAAETLGLPFRRFDMSEYADKDASVEFCGSDKVYGNAKAGNVTSFVEENPRCVLLFDEIEKAHISVIHLFLQLLDAGRLRDSYTDKEISFSDTIIILTTNAGKQLYEESESEDFSTVSRKVIIKALQKDINPQTKMPFFPDAICSRFASGNVVMFNHVSVHNLYKIAKKEFERQAENLKKKTGISFQIDEHVCTALLFQEGSEVDARTIKSRAKNFFNDELYELLRLISSDKVKTSIENIENIHFKVNLDQTKTDISKLFMSSAKTKVLVFADEEAVELCSQRVPDMDFVGAQTVKDAVDAIKDQDIDFVLLDVNYGAPTTKSDKLNIEDVDSPARDFFKVLKEQGKVIPVYLLEKEESILTEEEKNSFKRQGVRDVLCPASAEKDEFSMQLDIIALSLHQQASMVKLARENKLVSFETAQTITENGKTAEIKLFDFKTVIAVESEDAKNILSSVSKPDVCFDDVIGAEDAKKELAYFVEYLKNPKKYMGTGVKAPKGIVLYGPPGTGKTMLAKAMANEAGVTFIATEGNHFLKKFVGEGSEMVHKLFKTARKYAPSILFIDEIDAIAKERKGGENSGSRGEETLTAFLTEMDGFVNDTSKPVFVLAATNFDVEPEKDKSLDPALMRRFDRRVYIDLPGKEERMRFLKMKISKNKALDISEKQVDNISMRATGMSLNELDSVVELALRSAISEGSDTVNDAIFEEAFETFNGGEAKKWDTVQLERVARHEAGHALISWLSGETPSYLTIVARGSHGGYMQHKEHEEKNIYTKDELLTRVRTSLGGRAAEIIYYGDRDGVSTGASGDLAVATDIAQQIVCTYGMDKEFGMAVVNCNKAVNNTMTVKIRNAVNRILDVQMDEALKLITENKDKIDLLVEELMTKNHLNGEDIDAVLKKDRKLQ